MTQLQLAVQTWIREHGTLSIYIYGVEATIVLGDSPDTGYLHDFPMMVGEKSKSGEYVIKKLPSYALF